MFTLKLYLANEIRPLSAAALGGVARWDTTMPAIPDIDVC